METTRPTATGTRVPVDQQVRIFLKSSERYQGSLCEWKPRLGYFTIGELLDQRRINFRDIDSATWPNQVLNATGAVGDVDLLERARREGWDGT